MRRYVTGLLSDVSCNHAGVWRYVSQLTTNITPDKIHKHIHVLINLITCQISAPDYRQNKKRRETTNLTMSGAMRQAEYIKREIRKRETAGELEPWLAKHREQSKMLKRRERARKKMKGMITGDTANVATVTTETVVPASLEPLSMTPNAIRQRRFQQKRKAEKEVARAAVQAASVLVPLNVPENPYSNIV
jgi:hypothetical protein